MLATKRAPSDTRTIPWGLVGIEALAIFLSVFLAFGVTAWRESRAETATARQAMENFQIEILRNRESVQNQLPYHQRMWDELLRLQREGVPETYQEAFRDIGWRGPSGVVFLRTAWLGAEATGALPLLDFELAGLISTIYASQDDLSSLQWQFAATALDATTWADARQTTFVAMLYFEMVTELENNLLRMYDRTLAELEERIGPPPPSSANRTAEE